MESSLTNLEMNAVFQLIQLSGASSPDFQMLWVKFPKLKGDGNVESMEEVTKEEEEEEESIGEISPLSPSEEALPRRRMRLRPIVDIYKGSRRMKKLRQRKM